jgi:protein-tyrosine kinase
MRFKFRETEAESALLPSPEDIRRPMPVHDQAIGDILGRAKGLTPTQIDKILAHQREHGLRFGDAAVALKLVNHEDVLWALAQQFHYPYSPEATDAFDPELIVASNPFSDEAETFRDLRSQLMAERGIGGDLGRSFAVASPDAGDGKSFFAANVAIAFSQLGGRTLLVDADMRTGRMNRLFGLGEVPGLSGILSGRTDANVIHQIAELPSLHVMPVGTVPPNPLELIQRPAFSLLLAELNTKFDYVIVDTPAASLGADARVVAGKCGAALVLSRRGRTRMQAMRSLLNSIRRARAEVVGVVMNEY